MDYQSSSSKGREPSSFSVRTPWSSSSSPIGFLYVSQRSVYALVLVTQATTSTTVVSIRGLSMLAEASRPESFEYGSFYGLRLVISHSIKPPCLSLCAFFFFPCSPSVHTPEFDRSSHDIHQHHSHIYRTLTARTTTLPDTHTQTFVSNTLVSRSRHSLTTATPGP